jgi:hypothetical protein
MKNPLCPRGGRVGNRRRPGGHEQRLQEQPSRLVRTNFRHPALCKDWAQLNRRRKSEGALPAEVMRRVAHVTSILERGTFSGRVLRFRAASATSTSAPIPASRILARLA